MNNSLEAVTGTMKELTRYGSLSSENLKDMMEFLEKGQNKADLGNIATTTYTYANMSKDERANISGAEYKMLQSYAQNLNAEGNRYGMKKLDFTGAKTADEMQERANAMRTQINAVPDDMIRKQMLGNLGKIQNQIGSWQSTSGSALSMAASDTQFDDPIRRTAKLFKNLNLAAQDSPDLLRKMATGGGDETQKIYFQQLASLLGVNDPKQAANLLRTEASNRVQEAGEGTEADKKRNYKLLTTELDRNMKAKGGWNMALTKKGYGGYIGKTLEETNENMMKTAEGQAAMQDTLQTNVDYLAFDKETQKKIMDSQSDGQATDGQQAMTQKQQLEQARGVAMRTQTVGDLLTNTFKPLLISLLSEVEHIASWIAKHFGGDAAKDQAQTMADMAALPKAIEDYGNKAEALMKDPSKAAEAQAAIDAMKYLQGIQDHGILSPKDQSKVEGLLGINMPGQMSRADMMGAGVAGAIGPGGGLVGNAVSYYYSIYDAHFNQSMTHDGSVGKSGEQTQPQPGNTASMKPGG